MVAFNWHQLRAQTRFPASGVAEIRQRGLNGHFTQPHMGENVNAPLKQMTSRAI